MMGLVFALAEFTLLCVLLLLFIPIALNSLIHLVGDIVNEFLPDSANRGSNSTRLKLGLFRVSHSPRNSRDDLNLSQFRTTSLGSFGF